MDVTVREQQICYKAGSPDNKIPINTKQKKNTTHTHSCHVRWQEDMGIVESTNGSEVGWCWRQGNVWSIVPCGSMTTVDAADVSMNSEMRLERAILVGHCRIWLATSCISFWATIGCAIFFQIGMPEHGFETQTKNKQVSILVLLWTLLISTNGHVHVPTAHPSVFERKLLPKEKNIHVGKRQELCQRMCGSTTEMQWNSNTTVFP